MTSPILPSDVEIMLADLDFVECKECAGTGVGDDNKQCRACEGEGTVAEWSEPDLEDQ